MITLVFVLQKSLGWSTYLSQLSSIVEERRDVRTSVIPLFLTPLQGLGLKRTNMSPLARLYRRRDPIDAFEGAMGKGIRSRLNALSPSAVHFAGHWPAAALSPGPPGIPFTVAMDATRAAIDRDLTQHVWTAAEMAHEANLLRQASRIYPMSNWAAASLVTDCGVAEEQIRVMPPSVDLTRFVRPLPSGEGPARVVFIGNDFRRKGGDRLRRWVAGPLAGKIELHIVSSDSDAGESGPGVVVHGHLENEALVQELLPAMDILCLPTSSDMSPQVLAEAAAAGLPAVASRIAGLSDLVVDHETGFLIPADDDAAFVAALVRLAENRSMIRAMSEKAIDHARRTFDSRHNFNMLIDDMIKIASARTPGDVR